MEPINFLNKNMFSIYRLPNKIENEKIVKVIRKDFFILFKKVVLFVVIIILPLVFFYLMSTIMPNIMRGQISYPLVVLGTSAYYLFMWVFFFFSFIDYYLDVWIITSERIIDIQQQGFFSRIIAEQKLFRIQDVTSEVHGFFPTILHYGDVFIQTAGTKQRFFFHEVPQPDRIRDNIIKLAQIKKARQNGERVNENLKAPNTSTEREIAEAMKH